MRMLSEYRRLFPFLKRYISSYIPGLICLIAADTGQIYIPGLTRDAVNSITEGTGEPGAVLSLVVRMVLTAMVIAVTRFGWRFFIGGSARRIENGLRKKLFDHLIKLPPSWYDGRKTGDIMARFTNDMGAIRMACGMAVVSLVDGLFMTAFILAVLFSRYPEIAGWLILPFPVLAVLVLGMGRLLGRRSKLVQEGFSSLSAQIQETLSGIRVFKALSREDYAVRKFNDLNDEYMKRTMSLVRIWGFLFPLINFLAGLTSLLLLRFGGLAVAEGTLTPGDFAAILSYLALMVWPMMGAGFTINWLERGAASLQRVGEFLDSEPEIKSVPRPSADRITGGINIRDLSFRWQEKEVLSGMSFDVPEGTSLGILGRTGSGKSTLVNLMPRIYDPPPGTVFVGGNDVRSYQLQQLRSGVGLVPQESFLFSATIRENICFAVPSADDDLIDQAAEFSTISRDLREFPFGLETVVGERGHTLSGGQKQRIAISRAFLTDPEVLIFDDCLSAVDSETEAEIMKQFLLKRRGKTSVIISNRTGTLAYTDKILVIEDGAISQHGTHDSLVGQDGLYRIIHSLQQAESDER